MEDEQTYVYIYVDQGIFHVQKQFLGQEFITVSGFTFLLDL